MNKRLKRCQKGLKEKRQQKSSNQDEANLPNLLQTKTIF
jgi:hypothetical protein